MTLADHVTRLLATPVTPTADHSWDDTTTHIQRFRLPTGEEIIAKHNTTAAMFAREHHALRHWAPALAPHAPRLIAADPEHHLLVMTALPGTPLCDQRLDPTSEQHAYRQAGRLLRRLHAAAPPQLLPDFGQQRAAYIRAQLAGDTAPLTAEELAFTHACLTRLEDLPPQSAVPSHLDFTSRNLLLSEGGTVSVIDFETSRYEAAGRDFLRISMRALLARDDLRDAFYEGYGRQPSPAEQHLMSLCGAADAAAIAVTATANRQDRFTAEGHIALQHFMRTNNAPAVP
ncbi:aminoglycoside phosphotransferase family protein [Nonomuraea sp. FMUSA5-5]|uniref:Aminoglycoside phosphotransferase family protein n=1 Tax=Nonomuraea composti TaxID=2720023 RepID=A0ABX1BCC3_9ACTN|nr:aminoglycoside phosphotransferase family protein [Nonomuraea sp. FMUSA5-5]NJP95438.1 aminoglycoside phosphotransferase family protein [Nonomuraea sp. FMUSA5-5]